MVVRLARGRFHYGWIVAAVTFVMGLMAAGFRSAPTVSILPLEHEFGWTRAGISVAFAINLALFGLCAPFGAAFMERFGVRRVMLGSLVLVAAGAGLSTLMRAEWQLYLLWGGVVGIGSGATAGSLAAIVANRWFVKQRGLVVGLVSTAGATGQLIFLPLLMELVTTFGWRSASIATAGTAALLVAPLVLLLMRDDPHDVGLRPYGADHRAAAPTCACPFAQGNPVANACRGLLNGFRSRDFWFLSGTFFICGASANGLIGTHLVPHAIEHGVPEVTAASFLAIIGVMDIVGSTVSGWLTDRVDSRWLLCWYYGFRGLALLFLPYAYGSGYLGLALFAVLYGLDWVATLPPTVRLTTDLFGPRQAGVLYAWIFAAHQVGAAVAAFGAGAVRTWLGDYQVGFMASGLLCLVASGLALRIGRRPSVDIELGPRLPLEAPASA